MDMSNHPLVPAGSDDARERIVAALRHRAGVSQHRSDEGATPQETPAFAGDRSGVGEWVADLPALVTALPGDHTRAPQTEFVRERQVVFLENLSVTGSVRSAATAAGVSHQTAYRARRGQGHFRLAWDAALVAARANAEATLASRAIDGVEEQVFYHGQVIATRRRYYDRLLLAHLARLDKLTSDDSTHAFAEDWDDAMARFAAGEEPVASAFGGGEPPTEILACAGNQNCSPALRQAGRPAAQDELPGGQAGASCRNAQPPEKNSPGPYNTRSMSPAEDHHDGRSDLEWEALHEEMAEARPLNAPPPELLGDPEVVEACQIQAFELGDEDWWRYGENFACFEEGEDGVWRPEPADDPANLPPGGTGR